VTKLTSFDPFQHLLPLLIMALSFKLYYLTVVLMRPVSKCWSENAVALGSGIARGATERQR